jgi:L-serine dehydratase
MIAPFRVSIGIGSLMLSVLDIFKIGIGPSSSHTVGPMVIARQFLEDVAAAHDISTVHALTVDLFGSLAFTGEGHGTDRAILLGLMGFTPSDADADMCETALGKLAETGNLALHGGALIHFAPKDHIRFRTEAEPLAHPNGMRLHAYDKDNNEIFAQTYFSLGGGFTCREDELGTKAAAPDTAQAKVPHPFKSGAELLSLANGGGTTIAEIVLANEDTFRPRAVTLKALDAIWAVMNGSIDRGLKTEGILPGALKVRRRAGELYGKAVASGDNEREAVFDWLNAYAMAVNEENAAGGQVVTAPTNGAAGIIPAVIRLYCMGEGKGKDAIHRFLLTAAAIGMLYKANASISGAEMGCQGEVGVACSMAAGGLVAAWGGTNEMAEHAAEIGMEHNLGLTCDPVGGLVQIPCIERNAIGAVKAVNAARLAMRSTGPHRVSLDQVIETMRQTGLDMNSRYKETSQGGLAVNVVEC